MARKKDKGTQRGLYDELYVKGYRACGFWFGGNRTRLIALTRMVNEEINDRKLPCVLDIGCGNGVFSYRFAKTGTDVVGIDLSLTAIKKGKSEAYSVELTKPDFLVASAENLPFKDGSFQIVFHSEVLEHVKRPELAVSESARVLEDRGALIASIPCANEHSYEWWVSRIKGQLRTTSQGCLFYWDTSPRIGHPMIQRFSSQQIVAWHRNCDIRIDRIQYHGHIFTPIIEYQLYRSVRPFKGDFEEPASKLPMRLMAQLFDKVCRLDYTMLKNYPFGSNMLIHGLKKPESKPQRTLMSDTFC